MRPEGIILLIAAILVPFGISYVYALPIQHLVAIYISEPISYIIYTKAIKFFAENPRNEPMKEAFEYVKQWWKVEMRTGEDLDWEDSEAYEAYYSPKPIYCYKILREERRKPLLIALSTAPKRVFCYKEENEFSTKSVFDILYEKYGVRPLPVPPSEFDGTKFKDFGGKRDELPKSKKPDEKKEED